MKETTAKNTVASRFRTFATMIYPESAPDHWLDTLRSFHVEGFVSPLHDCDTYSDKRPKKPHWHVVLYFHGMKSPDQVKVLFDQIGGVGLEIVNSFRAYARYLCHLDDPDKAQYDPSAVTSLSGLDYFETIGSLDRYSAISEMEEFCEKERIYSYAELSRYARLNRPAWHRILCSCATVHMTAFLKSCSWGNKIKEAQP